MQLKGNNNQFNFKQNNRKKPISTANYKVSFNIVLKQKVQAGSE